MDPQPLVSVIVPTRNSEEFLHACLRSIILQTYPNIELIVVDRDSTDSTKQIARTYTQNVYNHGPERSAQVNFGVTKASGTYIYKVDSDFLLDPALIAECVAKTREGFDAVVVYNTPDVSVSWIAKIHKFEFDLHRNSPQYGSARFVRKDVYQSIGGFNEEITAGEDYDFQNKLNRSGYKTGFVEAEAIHLGEPKKFLPYLVKCYQYGKDAAYYQKNNPKEFDGRLNFILLIWFYHWKEFLSHPLLGTGLLFYYFFKFSFAAVGLLRGKMNI